MEKPIVSIIVPCFQQAEFIGEALGSVLNQSFTSWECIIINDGSPDNTGDIASEWVKKDLRFRYIEQGNKGVCNARNTGISASKGKFILPLDADDTISQDYLELAVKSFLDNPALKLIYCEAKKFGLIEGNWNLPSFSLNNLAKENIIFSSALYKKEDWLNIGGYDENMRYGLEDWEFWIALLKNGGEVRRINQIGFYYRITETSRNKNFNKKQLKWLYNYISVKHADFFISHLGSPLELKKEIIDLKFNFEQKLNSEKFLLNKLFKKVLGFSPFPKQDL